MLPYDYYPQVLRAIDLISQGQTKTRACDKAGVSIPLFHKTVNSVPQFAELLTEAESRGYDAMADMLLTIDHEGIYAQSDPKMAKVISDNIKWLLEKRRNKQYGTRVEVTHNITADKAITDALIAGRNRAALAYSGDVIDIVPELVVSEETIMAELLS